MLALFLEEVVPAGLPPAQTIELIHDQGGLAVAAHPFHPIRYRPGRASTARKRRSPLMARFCIC
jgi:predicted metal-dependent phosphoesterase TrpH